MPIKKFIKDYLSFSRKERVGLLALLGLILTIYLLPLILERERKFPLERISVLAAVLDSQERREIETKPERKSFKTYPPASSQNLFKEGLLFKFDPNQLPAQGWKELGLGEKTIKTIENYRNKGGRFRKPEDLRKVWGLPTGFYDRVKDYITIEGRSKSEQWKNELKRSEPKLVSLNINEADTTAWIALPGIGSKLASRIVNFREKLGGFYSVEQVGETFGLADSVFQKIKPHLRGGGDVRKLNINSATKEELKLHPYLRWNLANAIVEYRSQHGRFKNLEELKNITLIDEATFKKIVVYVEL